ESERKGRTFGLRDGTLPGDAVPRTVGKTAGDVGPDPPVHSGQRSPAEEEGSLSAQRGAAVMEETFDRGGVRGVLHRPEAHSGDAIVLAHGAGSNHAAPLLVTLAKGLSEAGFLVLRYDLPYRMAGRPTPPPPASQASDREGILRAVGEVR